MRAHLLDHSGQAHQDWALVSRKHKRAWNLRHSFISYDPCRALTSGILHLHQRFSNFPSQPTGERSTKRQAYGVSSWRTLDSSKKIFLNGLVSMAHFRMYSASIFTLLQVHIIAKVNSFACEGETLKFGQIPVIRWFFALVYVSCVLALVQRLFPLCYVIFITIKKSKVLSYVSN